MQQGYNKKKFADGILAAIVQADSPSGFFLCYSHVSAQMMEARFRAMIFWARLQRTAEQRGQNQAGLKGYMGSKAPPWI